MNTPKTINHGNGILEEHADGVIKWFKNSKLHKEDGPAIIRENRTKEWFLNGIRHREDGPAIMFSDGTDYWYLNGERHREDGPAIEHKDGLKKWYLNGKELSEKEFNAIQLNKELQVVLPVNNTKTKKRKIKL